ncbi:General secretion pathway protein D [Candidatus Magnetoovum chiemensis]|nr:General secretion pathway protein D [Candidatus Magnetoovum chiemensis]
MDYMYVNSIMNKVKILVLLVTITSITMSCAAYSGSKKITAVQSQAVEPPKKIETPSKEDPPNTAASAAQLVEFKEDGKIADPKTAPNSDDSVPKKPPTEVIDFFRQLGKKMQQQNNTPQDDKNSKTTNSDSAKEDIKTKDDMFEKPKDASVMLPSISPAADAKTLTQESAQSSPSGPKDIKLTFDDLDIYEVTHTVFRDILKTDYLIDQRIKGRITFNTTSPISKEDVLPVMSTIYRLYGIGVIKEKNIYRIIPLSILRNEPAELSLGRDISAFVSTGLSKIQIVPLNFVSAQDMIDILTPFLTVGATATKVPNRNYIVIADTVDNVNKLLEIVRIFDDDVFQDIHIEIFIFKNLSVKDAIGELSTVLPIFSGSMQETLKVKYLPIDRLNALLVVSHSKEYLEQVGKWIEVLDNMFEGARPQVYVYPLQNSKAEHVYDILKQILASSDSSTPKTQQPKTPQQTTTDSKTPPQQQQPQGSAPKAVQAAASSFVSPDTKIYFDEPNNSLIILALPKDYSFIKETIKKIDIVPRQVLIEAMIVEVTLEDDLSYGVEWYLESNFKMFSNKYSAPMGTFFTDSSTTTTLPSGGFAFGVLDSANQLRGLFQALSSKSKVNVISTPHILVNDNSEAKIQVGDQIPILKNVTPVDGTTTSQKIYEYKDTGVTLKVKPQINESGVVKLHVYQEVSSVDASNPDAETPRIFTRNAETDLIVQDAHSIVIAGLIKENQTKGFSGIPLLSDIPLIGPIFGSNVKQMQRTELLIIITPHVVKSFQEADALTKEFKEKLTGLRDMLGSKEKEKE